ncbi:MOP flippase family protein [Herbaspirillum sp. NPDC087042]|uniref:MOP flippase family protein n=1 Tax=Herbaspirillum sp. NPDC087042 TaxID=3364004 RepID=UPI00381CA432
MASAMSNARWLTLSQMVRIALQMVSIFILSRLLAPSEYGLLAMATVAVNFASLLRDMGTGAAVIQKETLTRETTNTVFWLNIGLGVSIAVILVAISPMVEDYFRTPHLAPVLCLMALSFPLTSSCAVHSALLERESSFRTLARIEIVSASVALVTAITLAFTGFGVYSLVWQTLVSAMLSALQLWLSSGWRPEKIWSRSEFRGLWRFSGNLTGFSFVNFFARNADSMVIGRILGAIPLGIYAQAYKVMMFPLQSMSYVANRALFPVMSRQQGQRAEMARLYFRSLRLIATVTAPMMAGLWLLREPFVRVALGPQWQSVPIILAWLAPVGFLQSVISTTGAVFMATGRTDLMMRLGALGAVLQVGSFFIGVHWGIEGVAICYLVANILNAIPHFYFATRELHSNLLGLLRALWQPVVFSLVMLGLLAPLLQWMRSDQFAPQAVLFGLAAFGAVVFAGLTLLFSRELVLDMKKMVGRA